MAATFSYAQAAKGISPQPSVKPTSAEPNNAASTPEEQNPGSDAQVTQDPPASEMDAPREAEKTVAPNGKEAESATVPNAKQDVSGTSSPSVGNSSITAPKDEESSNSTVNGTSESTWDKQSQASGPEKPNGIAVDETKEKSSEKGKNAPPPKELKAAPLPTINVWQQRREAQEAKVKTMKPTSPATKAGAIKTASAASSTSGEPQQDPSKATLKKKGPDGATESAKPRSKADGGKGRDDDASVPPVGDASMWPTPQVAQGEEKKKAQEKIEKADKSEKTTGSRPHGKEKWMPVPYVPSAVFSTPLPTTGARRGGRSARGGRDAGRHAAHGAGGPTPVDKAVSGQPAQGSSAKQASSDRGRNEQNTNRVNSLPAQSGRPNSAEIPAGSETRKGVDRNRGPNEVNAGKQANGTDAFSRPTKGFAKNQDFSNRGDRNPHLSVDSQAGPRNGSTQDRRFENGPKSADFGGFYEHRDHHNHRGESRPERGRGGSHRGRGGHSAHSQAPYYANPHMQPHSFAHPKSFGYKSSMANGRGVPLRSPSLPNSAMYGVFPYPTDINTMYAAYQPMPAGPVTAMPYQTYMEPYSLMSMISMQLEYYFSVDNLCKDLFLRKHMDSQGFVPLSFIANFKRIKSLTEDFDFLRHVSRQIRHLEHHTGEDGVDRLRPRENWEQWVFPMDMRDPSAQHEGPPPAKDESLPVQDNLNGAVNGAGHNHSLPNGTSESRVSKTPLSSTAPEFSPSKPLVSQSE